MISYAFAARATLAELLILCGAFGVTFCAAAAQAADPPRYALAIHGGAISVNESLTDEQRQQQEAALRSVLEQGLERLAQGKSSVDTVEHVLRQLEDDPLFNAGRGAVLNEAGEVELDASIMDGSNLACGAVAAVRSVKHPISLARLVMTRTRHVLLVGSGAEQFADRMQAERATLEYFRTPSRQREWQQRRAAEHGQNAPKAESPEHMGTVGCVALDVDGHLAAGTSTGGLGYKMVGRVGDSPLIGAGTYADDRTCAVSCTGTGEEFIRRAAAFDVSALMAYRMLPVDEAVRIVVQDKLPDRSGAMIAVSAQGQITMQFNTAGLARAAGDSAGHREVQVGP